MEFGPDLINILVPGTGLIAKAGKFVVEQAGWTDKFQKFVATKSSGPAGTTLDQSHIFEQTTNVLKALAAKRPLILVLDDLQWVDGASTSLLFHLSRRIGESRLLVVGAYRGEEVKLGRGGERHPLEKVLAECKRYFGDVWVDLDQAEKEEARQFVDELLDLEPNRLGPSFRRTLVQHTGGHPLFAVELLRDMQEHGDLERDADGCWSEATSLDWDALPPRVEGVIEERIGRLEKELQETLTVGSVEGVEFTAEVIARVRTVDERSLVRRLSNELDRQHQLVISQGIRRVGVQPLSAYCFRHSLFQKYLYHKLDAAERSYLHRDVGNALVALYGEEAEEISVRLAWHFQEAALVEKSVAYLRQAGEQACRRYANEEAITYFRRALALLEGAMPGAGRQQAATELHEKLGDVLFLSGQADEQAEEAKAAYMDALAWAPQSNRIWRSRLQRKIGKAWERQRHLVKALQAYDLAEATLGQEPAGPAVDWWHEWIAIQIDRIWTTFWTKGPWRKMLPLTEKTGPAVQQYGTPAQRSSFYECLVLVDNRRYRYVVPEETVAHAEASLAASQESGDLGLVARSQFWLGFCHLWRGDLDKASEAMQAALTLGEQMGDVDVRLMCLALLPVVYRKRGQVEETRRLLARSLIEAKERGSLEYEGTARANLAWVAWREGNLDEAQAHGQAALELWRPPIKVLWRSLALWPLIGVDMVGNQVSAAIDHARALLDPEQQPLPDALATIVEGVVAAWETGESETTRTHLDRALELAQELGYL